MRADAVGRALIPILIILYSSYMIWEQFTGAYRESTRYYALFMGGVAIALALAVLVTDFIAHSRRTADGPQGDSAPERIPMRRYAQIATVLVSAALLVFFLEWIGYLIGFFVFLVITLRTLDVRSPVQLLLIPAVTVAVVHVVFVTWLQLRLPAGVMRGLL